MKIYYEWKYNNSARQSTINNNTNFCVNNLTL